MPGQERPQDEMCQREGVSALLAPQKQGRRGFRAMLRSTSPTEEVFTSFLSQARAPSLAEASVCSGQGVYSAEHLGRRAARGPGKRGGFGCRACTIPMRGHSVVPRRVGSGSR